MNKREAIRWLLEDLDDAQERAESKMPSWSDSRATQEVLRHIADSLHIVRTPRGSKIIQLGDPELGRALMQAFSNKDAE